MTSLMHTYMPTSLVLICPGTVSIIAILYIASLLPVSTCILRINGESGEPVFPAESPCLLFAFTARAALPEAMLLGMSHSREAAWDRALLDMGFGSRAGLAAISPPTITGAFQGMMCGSRTDDTSAG